jgi:hypothetical protein
MSGVKRYAEGTTVSSERSQIQIQQLLKTHGASDVASGERGNDQAMIGFRFNQLQYRISMSYPALQSFSRSGRTTRTPVQMKAARDQEIRRLWRALLLVIKAKIEIVESGILTFEEEFMPYILTADGRTLGEWVKPQLERHVPLLLSPVEEELNDQH